MNIVWVLLLMIGSYLLGSFSPSVLLSKTAWGIDIREYGSHNAGTTNMLRVMGWGYGLLTFLTDLAKGVLPALAGVWMGIPYAPHLAALAACLGHAYPIFAHFKGGKCVVTATGALMVLQPGFVLIALAAGLVICLITRIVSVGSLAGYLIATVVSFFVPGIDLSFSLLMCALTLLLFFRHKENIRRLLKGEEKKLVVGNGKKPKNP